ncbi:MAG: hypothetical protein ACM3YN_07725 [Parcubacteria group bacterium]
MPDLTPRDAVTRAMAAMEIAESCTHPQIRESFTNLAGDWLKRAGEAARKSETDEGEAEA